MQDDSANMDAAIMNSQQPAAPNQPAADADPQPQPQPQPAGE